MSFLESFWNFSPVLDPDFPPRSWLKHDEEIAEKIFLPSHDQGGESFFRGWNKKDPLRKVIQCSTVLAVTFLTDGSGLFQAKQRASIKWLLAKAYNHKTPDELREPFYKDHDVSQQ